jgi:isopenicillin N synthase-like dioxygenase
MMADVTRITSSGEQEVRTGLGWRRVLSPTSKEATTDLPIIDIADITSSNAAKRKAVAKTICDAAITAGFFYVRNHGIPEEDIKSIFRESKRFFHDLSLAEKMEYDTAKHEHYYGYYPITLDPQQPSGASKLLMKPDSECQSLVADNCARTQ